MSLSCAIVGVPNVGKTTLFNALTAAGAATTAYAYSSTEPNLAVVDVPDENLGRIAEFIETRRIVPATVSVVDIPGLAAGSSRGEGLGNRFLHHVRETDALMHVVRCFENAAVLRDDPVDAAGDIETFELELALADLDTVTRGVERVAKKARTGDKQSLFEQKVFERAKETLESGAQLRSLPWKPEELDALRPLCLLTQKPVLYVANVGEQDLAGEGEHARAVAARAEATGAGWIALCGDLECELRRLEGEERDLFMSEYGVTELGRDRLIRATYALLGLQTFYTAGEIEVRAWTIRSGDTAPVAAGKIHTDFLKGFIRAEVYSVEDLFDLHTEAAIRAKGRLRTEGRDYVMRPNDVCHFLVGR